MSCSSTEELFERFLDGEVNPAERRRVLSHIDRCSSCRGVLEELRVVDALLLEPRRIELAPNFTVATMAEARALPPPAAPVAPLRAYVVAYLAGMWMIVAAAALLAPQAMHALAGTAVDIGHGVLVALAGLSRVISHALSHGGSGIAAVLTALLALDVTLVVAFGAALTVYRPGLIERARS